MCSIKCVGESTPYILTRKGIADGFDHDWPHEEKLDFYIGVALPSCINNYVNERSLQA